MQAVRKLKCHAAGYEVKANTADSWSREVLDKISELRTPVQMLNQTVSGQCGQAAGLMYVEWVRIQSVIRASLPEDEGTVSNKCSEQDGFSVGPSSDAPSPSAEGSYDQAQVRFIVRHFHLLSLRTCY